MDSDSIATSWRTTPRTTWLTRWLGVTTTQPGGRGDNGPPAAKAYPGSVPIPWERTAGSGADAIDGAALREAFGTFPSGVTALCAEVDGLPVGMAASSFTAVSLIPPLVSICVQLTSSTWPRLRSAGHVGLSVLARSHEATCRALADKHGDRFAGVDTCSSPTGAIFVEGAPLWMECTLENEFPAGDHFIALFRVARLRADHSAEPLIFHRSSYRELAGS